MLTEMDKTYVQSKARDKEDLKLDVINFYQDSNYNYI